MSHLNVPLWYADCFELKATLARDPRETSAPPLIIYEKLN